jgi:hypothetical protein
VEICVNLEFLEVVLNREVGIMFDFIRYFQCCWEIFKEDFKDIEKDKLK